MKKEGHIITCVHPDSMAEELDLTPGDALLEINGHTLDDIFDYQYYMEVLPDKQQENRNFHRPLRLLLSRQERTFFKARSTPFFQVLIFSLSNSIVPIKPMI